MSWNLNIVLIWVSLWTGMLNISSKSIGYLDFSLRKSSVQFIFLFLYWVIDFLEV
jgi:hypothetical protein